MRCHPLSAKGDAMYGAVVFAQQTRKLTGGPTTPSSETCPHKGHSHNLRGRTPARDIKRWARPKSYCATNAQANVSASKRHANTVTMGHKRAITGSAVVAPSYLSPPPSVLLAYMNNSRPYSFLRHLGERRSLYW